MPIGSERRNEMKLDYSGTREQGPVGFLSDTVVWQVAYFGAESARHHTTLVTCDAITTPTQLKSTIRLLTLADLLLYCV